MDMTIEMLDGGIKKINLIGKMDIEGTQQIELKFSLEFTVEQAFVILDLSRVDFMASIGIGVLVSAAKALKHRRGRMVLLSPQEYVLMTLERTHIDSVVPISRTLEEAKKALFDVPEHF